MGDERPERGADDVVSLQDCSAETGIPGFDATALQKFRRMTRPGRPSLLLRVLRSFLDETPNLLTAIRQGSETGATDEVVRAAHTLKASSAGFGAMALSSLCAELEREAEKRGAECASEFIDRLESEFDRIRGPLEAELQAEMLDADRVRGQ